MRLIRHKAPFHVYLLVILILAVCINCDNDNTPLLSNAAGAATLRPASTSFYSVISSSYINALDGTQNSLTTSVSASSPANLRAVKQVGGAIELTSSDNSVEYAYNSVTYNLNATTPTPFTESTFNAVELTLPTNTAGFTVTIDQRCELPIVMVGLNRPIVVSASGSSVYLQPNIFALAGLSSLALGADLTFYNYRSGSERPYNSSLYVQTIDIPAGKYETVTAAVYCIEFSGSSSVLKFTIDALGPAELQLTNASAGRTLVDMAAGLYHERHNANMKLFSRIRSPNVQIRVSNLNEGTVYVSYDIRTRMDDSVAGMSRGGFIAMVVLVVAAFVSFIALAMRCVLMRKRRVKPVRESARPRSDPMAVSDMFNKMTVRSYLDVQKRPKEPAKANAKDNTTNKSSSNNRSNESVADDEYAELEKVEIRRLDK